MIDYASFGAHIRRLRRMNGWTQEELAERIGVTVSFLGLVERGERKVSLETLIALANIFEAGVDEMLSPAVDLLPGALPDEEAQLLIKEISRAITVLEEREEPDKEKK